MKHIERKITFKKEYIYVNNTRQNDMHNNVNSGLPVLLIVIINYRPCLALAIFCLFGVYLKPKQGNQMKLETLIAGNDRKFKDHEPLP